MLCPSEEEEEKAVASPPSFAPESRCFFFCIVSACVRVMYSAVKADGDGALALLVWC